MNSLEKKLKELNPTLFGKLNETIEEVKLLLNQYIKNFPDYTDHSIHHTEKVFDIVSEVLTDEEIENLMMMKFIFFQWQVIYMILGCVYLKIE